MIAVCNRATEAYKHHCLSPTGISSFVATVDAGGVSVDPRVLSVEPRGS